MKVNLDTPSPEMDQDQSAQLNRDNIASLRKTMNKTGVNLSLDIQSKSTFTSTATTFTKIPKWEGIITCSGGMVEIEFSSSVLLSTTMTVQVKLLIDNNENNSRIVTAVGTAGFVFPISVKFKGSLGEGRHKVEVYAYVDTGTATFSAGGAGVSSSTQLTSTETIL